MNLHEFIVLFITYPYVVCFHTLKKEIMAIFIQCVYSGITEFRRVFLSKKCKKNETISMMPLWEYLISLACTNICLLNNPVLRMIISCPTSCKWHKHGVIEICTTKIALPPINKLYFRGSTYRRFIFYYMSSWHASVK